MKSEGSGDGWWLCGIHRFTLCLPTDQLPGWLCSTPCPPSALDFRCQHQGPFCPISSDTRTHPQHWEWTQIIDMMVGFPGRWMNQGLPLSPGTFAPKVPPFETWG